LRRSVALLAWQEARVATRLAQAQERLERGEHVSSSLQLRDHLVLGGGADRIVELALFVAQDAAQHDLGTRRQITCDLAFDSAHQERPQPAAQALDGTRVALCDRPRIALLEVAATAEQPGVQEVELAPQLVEAVLDRGTGQGDSKARL